MYVSVARQWGHNLHLFGVSETLLPTQFVLVGDLVDFLEVHVSVVVGNLV